MVQRIAWRLPCSRRGAAAVELAVLLPFLCFVLLLAVDFGRIFFPSLTIASCARNGALYASDPVTASESPYASTSQAANADATSLEQTPTVYATYGLSTDGTPLVQVRVDYQFQTITSFPGIPANVALQRSVYMRVAPTVPNF